MRQGNTIGRIARAMAGACCALGAAVALPQLAGAEGVTVHLRHGRIEPAEVTVAAGEMVRFVNEDAMPGGHSVVADDGSFRSPGLAKGEDWQHSFGEAGEHRYHIGEHPDAKGVVIVTEAAKASE